MHLYFKTSVTLYQSIRRPFPEGLEFSANNAVRSWLHERNCHICFWLNTIGVFKEYVENLIVFNAILLISIGIIRLYRTCCDVSMTTCTQQAKLEDVEWVGEYFYIKLT
jgi:hypothetical protein